MNPAMLLGISLLSAGTGGPLPEFDPFKERYAGGGIGKHTNHAWKPNEKRRRRMRRKMARKSQQRNRA